MVKFHYFLGLLDFLEWTWQISSSMNLSLIVRDVSVLSVVAVSRCQAVAWPPPPTQIFSLYLIIIYIRRDAVQK